MSIPIRARLNIQLTHWSTCHLFTLHKLSLIQILFLLFSIIAITKHTLSLKTPLISSLFLHPRNTTTGQEEELNLEEDQAMEVGVMKMVNKEKLDIKETELRLGLPGTDEEIIIMNSNGKRGHTETVDLKLNFSEIDQTDGQKEKNLHKEKTPAKTQVVGWPPVRPFRKNIMAVQKNDSEETTDKAGMGGAAFVKVSMDGAPYLRKVDLKMYTTYQELFDALGKMFSSFTIGMMDFMNESKLIDLLNDSDYVPTYEDRDGDWMLVGDVPWKMFVESCKRLRIMKGTEAIGLAPRAMEKCKNRS